MIFYSHPIGVEVQVVGDRPVLTTPQGGKIVIDDLVLRLWKWARNQSLAEILNKFVSDGYAESEIRCVLACLAEAGLLERQNFKQQTAFQALRPASGSLVSVVIVGHNSCEWLEECLPSLYSQSYQSLEIILVDNGSQDHTLDWVHNYYPQVKTVYNETPTSLAAAINMGVQSTLGEYLLILNPDVRLEVDAIAQMLHVFALDPRIAAVAAKLKFLWAPAFLNGIGNQAGSFSWGSDIALGHLDLGQFDHWQEIPSACFAATLIPRQIWKVVGPVDEDFPMYYEDLEWCYRARLFGYKIWAAPQAIVYHAFGGRVPTGHDTNLSPTKLRNVAYGRYRFTFKIAGDYLVRFLCNHWFEDCVNFFRMLIWGKWRLAQAYLLAWRNLISQCQTLRIVRQDLQGRRTLQSDQQLFGLQRDMPMPNIWHGLPELTWNLIKHGYLPQIKSENCRPMPEFDPKKYLPRLLIISHEVVNKKMAGPGMRYLEMALALNANLEVTLAIPSETDLIIPDLCIARYTKENPNSLQALVDDNDIAIISGYMVEKFPFLETTKVRLVVDLYDPMVLENLYYYLHESMVVQGVFNQRAVDIMNKLVTLGDFFICGNERQRDFWLGVLTANGRVNPQTFQRDSNLTSLIDVVGVGFPSRQPEHLQNVVRGKHSQIPDDARIVLWGGGIWNWLDPLNLVRAWPQVLTRFPKARLIFLGAQHPNPLAPKHEMVQKTISLAEKIGEKDRTILFYDWIGYKERESLLLEADIGVALHPVHIETRYSARTRILDYFWARLPVLVTEGDVTSEWVREYGLGQVAPEGDPAGIAEALIKVLEQPKAAYGAAFEPLAARFSWEVVVQPLLSYCLTGGYAPDRFDRLPTEGRFSKSALLYRTQLAQLGFIWRTEGSKGLLHRVWRYVQWRLAKP